MNEKYKNKQVMFFPLMVFIIFAFMMIGLCVYSANFYRRLSNTSDHLFKETVFLNYIRTKVRNVSEDGEVTLMKHDGHDVICIADENEYVTYIYYRDGNLYETYQEASRGFDLKDGSKILEIDDFKVDLSQDRLLVQMKDVGEWQQVIVGIKGEE